MEHVADLADVAEIADDVQVQHAGSLFDAAHAALVPEFWSALPAKPEPAAPSNRAPRRIAAPRRTAIAPPHRFEQSDSSEGNEASPQLEALRTSEPRGEGRRCGRPVAVALETADVLLESPVTPVRAFWSRAPGALYKAQDGHRHASLQRQRRHDGVPPPPHDEESSEQSCADLLRAPLQVPIDGLLKRRPQPGPAVASAMEHQTDDLRERVALPETPALADMRHEHVESLPATPETHESPPWPRKEIERAPSPSKTPVSHARPRPRQRRDSSFFSSRALPDASVPASLQRERINTQPSRSGRYSTPIWTSIASPHEVDGDQPSHVAPFATLADTAAPKESTSNRPPLNTLAETPPLARTHLEQMDSQPFENSDRKTVIDAGSASPLEEGCQRSRPTQPGLFTRRALPQERVNSWPSRGALLGRRGKLFGAPRPDRTRGAAVQSGMRVRAPVRDTVLRTNDVRPQTSLGHLAGMFSPVSNSAARESTDLDQSGTSGAGVRTGRVVTSAKPPDEQTGKQAQKFVVKATCRYGWEGSVHVLTARYSVKFAEFHRLLGDAFDMRVGFAICYFDDDSDRVTVSSDVEMEAMLDFVSRHADRLRIKMTPPHGYTSSSG